MKGKNKEFSDGIKIVSENLDAIIELLKEGKRTQDIADQFGLGDAFVFTSCFNKLGYKVRNYQPPRGDVRDKVRANKDYIIDMIKIGVKTSRIAKELKVKHSSLNTALVREGLSIKAIKHPNRKTLDSEYIKSQRDSGKKTFRELAEEFGVSTNIIAAHYYNHLDQRMVRDGRQRGK